MEVGLVSGVETAELRRAVLRPSWPVGSAMHGDEDPQALHVAARDDDGAVIGACVLLPNTFAYRPGPDQWQLRGMATTSGRRGAGIGSAVLHAALDAVAARGAVLLWCGARTTAVAFYARHGFAIEGDEYIQEETGLPHFTMWRNVEPARPPAASE